MTISPPARATTAIKKAANDGGKRRNPPTVVSPTPTSEQIGVLATKLVQKSSKVSSRKKKTAASAKPVRYARKDTRGKDTPLTVGHHNEIYDNEISNCSGCNKTEKSSSSSVLSSTSSLSLSASSAVYPPLMSRYCGGCGDILSTKAYGFDEERRDRRYRFHPEDGIGTDRERIREAAESVKQSFLQTIKVNGANSSGKVSSSKSTKASRKKRKAAKDQQLHNESLKGLPLWPDESLQMDMTMIEGLLSLKNTPKDEVDCRCWNSNKSGAATKESKRDLATTLATGKLPSPNAKKKVKAVKVPSSKTKPVVKKKSAVTKGSGSVTANNPEVISSKTVIVKCPKTGKKIKKTVRIVKKLVKKRRVLPKTPPANSPVGLKGPLPSPTTLSATSLTGSPKNSSPQGSVGDKENRGTPEGAPKESKKRSRDEGSVEDDDGFASDDGSEDGGASLKKRRRNDEKADLDLRERLMNCPLENGPYYPSHQELMELTTIRKRNALQTFYKRFNELRQFIAIFGDANVPQQFPENHSLGIWVNKMRMERKKWDTGSERTSLTERKIELLESIDFIWAQNHKGEIGWERRFQEIKKFKRKHGHCNVPTKSAENRALGRWVSTQRTMYKNYMKGFVGKSLTREEQERRIFLLLKEGFLFSMIPNGQNSGGTGEPNGDGTVPTDLMGTDVPSAGRVETLTESNPMNGGNADGTVTVDTIAAAATPTTPTTILSNATTTVATASGSKEPSAASTNTKGNDNGETVKNSPISETTAKTDETGEKKENCNNENDKKTMPFTPSQLEDGTLKSEAATSSPPASRQPSISQVSVTTTPTTTPSVSTTPSPNRSPKLISAHEEPDCDMTKIKSVTEEAAGKRDNAKDDKVSITDAMPVVPSLKIECELPSKPTKEETTEDPVSNPAAAPKTLSSDSRGTSRPDQTSSTKIGAKLKIMSMRPTMIGANEKSASSIPNLDAQPQEEKLSLREKLDIDKSPPECDFRIGKNEDASVASPPQLPEIESTTSKVQVLKKKPSFSNQKISVPEAPIKTEAGNDTLQTTAAEPTLVTSDGMRIIVTMKDPESPGARKHESTGGVPSMSPSRRSVRARKPSARQIEAEKSPLRESILGR